MNLSIEPGLLLGIITIVAGVTIFSFLKGRHMERMQQLHMGLPLANSASSYFEIKFGLLFIGVGAGILVALILNRMSIGNSDELYPALIFLFGGLGLLVSFFVVQEHKRK